MRDRTNWNHKCKMCGETNVEKFMPSQTYRCRACSKKVRESKQAAWLQWLKDNYDLKCERCGYNEHFSALDFHHLDPETKDFNLEISNLYSRAMSEDNFKIVDEEIQKCIILCANCHRLEHCQYDDYIGDA